MRCYRYIVFHYILRNEFYNEHSANDVFFYWILCYHKSLVSHPIVRTKCNNVATIHEYLMLLFCVDHPLKFIARKRRKTANSERVKPSHGVTTIYSPHSRSNAKSARKWEETKQRNMFKNIFLCQYCVSGLADLWNIRAYLWRRVQKRVLGCVSCGVPLVSNFFLS